MIIFELTNTENDPVYKKLETENGNRQFDFMHSVISASLTMQRLFISQQVIRALNFQAITCLHIAAGEYRPCDVSVGIHSPPPHYRVPALMDDFVNTINREWSTADPVQLATFVLWKLNNIHPFINGNGRTARAACYYTLCLKLGGWPSGTTILPELLKRDREEYVVALQIAHDSFRDTGAPDLEQLHSMVERLLTEQLASTPD